MRLIDNAGRPAKLPGPRPATAAHDRRTDELHHRQREGRAAGLCEPVPLGAQQLPGDGAHLRDGLRRREHHVQEHGHDERRGGVLVQLVRVPVRDQAAVGARARDLQDEAVLRADDADAARRGGARDRPRAEGARRRLDADPRAARPRRHTRRDAGHRERRRLRHDARPEGAGPLHRRSEHVLERRADPRERRPRHAERLAVPALPRRRAGERQRRGRSRRRSSSSGTTGPSPGW